MKKDTMLTTQKMIYSLKVLYDAEGLNGCDILFASILNHPAGTRKERLKLVVELIKVLFKIDTCQSTCFDNLDTKTSCYCSCNDFSVQIPFKNTDTLNLIEEL